MAQQKEPQDIGDLAAEQEEWLREQALKRRRTEGPPACGSCHYCNEPLKAGLRFCDVECRDDWQRLATKDAQAGREVSDDDEVELPGDHTPPDTSEDQGAG